MGEKKETVASLKKGLEPGFGLKPHIITTVGSGSGVCKSRVQYYPLAINVNNIIFTTVIIYTLGTVCKQPVYFVMQRIKQQVC